MAETEVSPGLIYLDVRGDAGVDINGVRVADADPFASEISTEPPVVRVGVPFDVTVATHTGDPACWSAAPSHALVEDNTATIAVSDAHYIDGRACRLFGGNTPRTDRVSFDQRGVAEVVIEGAREDAGVTSPHSLRFTVRVE